MCIFLYIYTSTLTAKHNEPKSLIQMCDMTNSYVRHDSYTSIRTCIFIHVSHIYIILHID